MASAGERQISDAANGRSATRRTADQRRGERQISDAANRKR